jgi:hypothetical protein
MVMLATKGMARKAVAAEPSHHVWHCRGSITIRTAVRRQGCPRRDCCLATNWGRDIAGTERKRRFWSVMAPCDKFARKISSGKMEAPSDGSGALVTKHLPNEFFAGRERARPAAFTSDRSSRTKMTLVPREDRRLSYSPRGVARAFGTVLRVRRGNSPPRRRGTRSVLSRTARRNATRCAGAAGRAGRQKRRRGKLVPAVLQQSCRTTKVAISLQVHRGPSFFVSTIELGAVGGDSNCAGVSSSPPLAP